MSLEDRVAPVNYSSSRDLQHGLLLPFYSSSDEGTFVIGSICLTLDWKNTIHMSWLISSLLVSFFKTVIRQFKQLIISIFQYQRNGRFVLADFGKIS